MNLYLDHRSQIVCNQLNIARTEDFFRPQQCPSFLVLVVLLHYNTLHLPSSTVEGETFRRLQTTSAPRYIPVLS